MTLKVILTFLFFVLFEINAPLFSFFSLLLYLSFAYIIAIVIERCIYCIIYIIYNNATERQVQKIDSINASYTRHEIYKLSQQKPRITDDYIQYYNNTTTYTKKKGERIYYYRNKKHDNIIYYNYNKKQYIYNNKTHKLYYNNKNTQNTQQLPAQENYICTTHTITPIIETE